MKIEGLGFIQLDIFPNCVNLKLLNGQKIKMLKLAIAGIKPSSISRPNVNLIIQGCIVYI